MNLQRSAPFLVLLATTGACSEPKDEEGTDNTAPPGALACSKPVAECKAAFDDVYTGTYTGDSVGGLILDVEAGSVVGTRTLTDGTSQAILDGRVSEFGELEFESEDGTKFTGQFNANHRISGTWSGPDGMGMFQAQGTKDIAPEATTSAGPSAASPSNTAPAPTSAPSTSSSVPAPSLVERAEKLLEACEAIKDCPDRDPIDCSQVGAETLGPIECAVQEQALLQCEVDNGCEYMTVCEPEANAAFDCILGASP